MKKARDRWAREEGTAGQKGERFGNVGGREKARDAEEERLLCAETGGTAGESNRERKGKGLRKEGNKRNREGRRGRERVRVRERERERERMGGMDG